MIPVNDPVSADSLPHIAHLLAGAFEPLRSAQNARSIPGLRPSHYRVMALIPLDGLRLTELAARASNRAKIVTLTRPVSPPSNCPWGSIADTEQQWSQALGSERYRELRIALFDIAGIQGPDSLPSPPR